MKFEVNKLADNSRSSRAYQPVDEIAGAALLLAERGG
jgi:hypothetical protein